MKTTEPDYLSNAEVELLLANAPSQKYKVMLLLLIDCGLLLRQCLQLKFGDFDFTNKLVTVLPLSTRRSETRITMSVSPSVYREMGNWIFAKGHTPDPDTYLFPGVKPGTHLTNDAVYNLLIRLSEKLKFRKITIPMLRRTFIARCVNAGTSPENIGRLMGYRRPNVKASKIHFNQEELKKNIENTGPRKPIFQQIISSLPVSYWRHKQAPVAPFDLKSALPACIGRDEPIARLIDYANRKINTIIIGSIGVGKSHLLETFEESIKDNGRFKILKMDDANDLRPSLTQLLIYLLKTDQQGVYNHLFPEFDYSKTVTKISRQNILHIAREIIKATDKNSYTLFIDNVDQLSPRSVQVLELFKDHFTIITTARRVPVNKSSFLWDFEIIRLKPLTRADSLQLVDRMSAGLAPEDQWLYKNHIYEQTNGNPRAIREMIERYRKEKNLTNEVVLNLTHTGALPEYDCTFLLLLFLACVACLRYLNHEVQNASFRVLGGIALVFLFITRYFFRFSKRKEI